MNDDEVCTRFDCVPVLCVWMAALLCAGYKILGLCKRKEYTMGFCSSRRPGVQWVNGLTYIEVEVGSVM